MDEGHRKFSLLLRLLLTFILVGSSPGEEQREINISQIIQDMDSNLPVKYNNVKICGNNAAIIEDLKIISIEITNSTIDVELQFNQINFSGPIIFYGTTFNKELLIDNSNINQEADFAFTLFNDFFSIYNTSFLGKETNFAASNFFQPISFTKAKFLGEAKFNNSNFSSAEFNQISFSNRGVDFSNSIFADDLIISDAIFEGQVSFEDAQLDDLELLKAEFLGMPVFVNTTFNGDASFDKVNFLNGCNFQDATFDYAEFKNVKSSGLISNFDKSHFNDDLEFSKLTVDSISSFKETSFNKSSNFEGTQFNKRTEFNDAIFRGNVSFKGSQFVDYLNLRGSVFYNYINFDNAIIKGDILCEDIDFRRDSWQKVHPGRISMNGTRFDRIFINWADLNHGFLVSNENAYLSLIDNFKKLGRIQDANDCYYEYKRYNSRNLKGLYSLADAYFWVFCGYGVRPEWALYWALFIIVIFSSYFWKNDNMEIVSALVFSITAFMSGTGKLFVEKPNYCPRNNHRISQFLFTLERILGGVLIILFLISLRRWVTI
jgi:uncharacterized protein YjbI with pentapeptide repeats